MRQPETLFTKYDNEYLEIMALCDLIRYYLSLETGFEGQAQHVADNTHILTADEEALAKWERFLHIIVPPQGDMTYEEWLNLRRQNIISAMGYGTRKTEVYLRERLDAFMGSHPYRLDVNKDGYSLFFSTDDTANETFWNALTIIEDVRPMNLQLFRGAIAGAEMGVSETILGSYQQDPPVNFIMKTPDTISFTTFLTNAIAQNIADLADRARVNGTLELPFSDKRVSGTQVSFLYVVPQGDFEYITQSEILDADGNVLSSYSWEPGTFPMFNDFALEHRVVVSEMDIPSSGSYAIVWQTDGGTIPVEVPSFGYPGQSILLPTVERENYVFEGWSILGNIYQAGEEYDMPDGPLIITATYSQRDVELRIQSAVQIIDGNNANVPFVQTFPVGTTVSFDGWRIANRAVQLEGLYEDVGFGNKITSIDMTEDKIVYARVIPAYDIYLANIYHMDGTLKVQDAPMAPETWSKMFQQESGRYPYALSPAPQFPGIEQNAMVNTPNWVGSLSVSTDEPNRRATIQANGAGETRFTIVAQNGRGGIDAAAGSEIIVTIAPGFDNPGRVLYSGGVAAKGYISSGGNGYYITLRYTIIGDSPTIWCNYIATCTVNGTSIL